MVVEVGRVSTFWRRYGLGWVWKTCWVAASKALYPALGGVTMYAYMCTCWLSWTHKMGALKKKKMGAFYWVQVIYCCLIAGYSPPGSSVHGIHQARILEWVTIPFSRGSSWPRDQTYVSCVGQTDSLLLSHQVQVKCRQKKENEIYLLLLFTHSIFGLPR